MESLEPVVNLFNEIGMLAKTPRSGFAFLGSGRQSVAEHSHRMTMIAYTLAALSDEPLDISKLLLMCLCHDLPEARTGDLNYVNKRYVKDDEAKIIDDLKDKTVVGKTISAYLTEYNENDSLEAQYAHDADQLELLLVLKEQHEMGNQRALKWFDNVEKRLQTKIGKSLAKTIQTTPADAWWQNQTGGT